MSQLFHPIWNVIARLSLVLGLLAVLGLGFFGYSIVRSPHMTGVGVAKEQPVPFSHKHHVGDIGMDCRYCHTTVEESKFAGIPPTETCMNCHSVLFTESPLLEPIRESFKNNTPVEWNRVHNLADFVYFDHSVHVAKGVSCVSCHGQVNEMPLMWKNKTLHMEWCLSCHRNPDKELRPTSEVFNMDWHPKVASHENVEENKNKIDQVSKHPINQLTNCSVCHR
jgi:hypothetical protein